MRLINNIFIHCTAGYGDVGAIRRFWRSLGWKHDGYHYFIYRDGTIIRLNALEMVTNGVLGYNGNSVHIAYQGGVDPQDYSKAVDTRTPEQKAALIDVVWQVLDELRAYQQINDIEILGHRDISPDKNMNGKVDSWERIKECPSFDAKEEYEWMVKHITRRTGQYES
jgi:N-acetylmuramoyl-L-alanine amidase